MLLNKLILPLNCQLPANLGVENFRHLPVWPQQRIVPEPFHRAAGRLPRRAKGRELDRPTARTEIGPVQEIVPRNLYVTKTDLEKFGHTLIHLYALDAWRQSWSCPAGHTMQNADNAHSWS